MGRFTISPTTYYCEGCNIRHYIGSKIGREHRYTHGKKYFICSVCKRHFDSSYGGRYCPRCEDAFDEAREAKREADRQQELREERYPDG